MVSVMREGIAKWEEELPGPDELMPVTQSLITPNLAMAFDIRSPESSSSPPVPRPPPELGVADDSARTLKRPRLVWTPELHKRFVDAVTHLGIKNAVPKTIMQLMSVDGLTRENVASHLQKYRLYLKRMHGNSGGGGAGFASASPAMDPATDHLFASSPIPPQFLHRVNQDHLLPFVHHHHHHPHLGISQFHQPLHQIGPFGPPNGQLDLPFLPPRPALRASFYESVSENYSEDLEVGTGGRKALALFPSAGN